MEVLSGPWAGLALLLRQTAIFPALWLSGLLLFLSVCVLLWQLVVYLQWKLNQGVVTLPSLRALEVELTQFSHERSAIYRSIRRSAHQRKRGTGAHAYT